MQCSHMFPLQSKCSFLTFTAVLVSLSHLRMYKSIMSDLAYREEYQTLPFGWDRGDVHAVRFLHMVKHQRHSNSLIRSMISLVFHHVVIQTDPGPMIKRKQMSLNDSFICNIQCRA